MTTSPARRRVTDVTNAERFAEQHGDIVRYVPERNTYLVWREPGVWAPDRGEIAEMAKQTVRSLYTEAADADDDKARQALGLGAMRSEQKGRLDAIPDVAKSIPDLVAAPEDFDASPMLLNCANGMVIDLVTGMPLHAKPSFMCSKVTGAAYLGCDVEAPTWMAFLHRVTDGREDLMAFLQRAVGYSMTGLTDEQVFFVLHGSGANGKSVFLQVVRHVLGDYAATADFESFLAGRKNGARSDIARLEGTRFVVAAESGEGRRLAEGLVKTLTGSDTVVARKLYENEREYRPRFKLWLATNHPPEIHGTDEAIWRRVMMIPFTVTIPEGERDHMLETKLREEAPGILAWALKGCEAWQAQRLAPPLLVRAANKRYRTDSDEVGQFTANCCTFGDGHFERAKALYTAFREWSEKNGIKPMSNKAFAIRLLQRDCVHKTSDKRGAVYRGIKVQHGWRVVDSGGLSDNFSTRGINKGKVTESAVTPTTHHQRVSGNGTGPGLEIHDDSYWDAVQAEDST